MLLVWSAGLDQFQELGSDVLEGVYLGAQYWHQVDTPLNRDLVKLTKAKYGINPTYPLTSDNANCQPSRAQRRAISRPRPEPAPVIIMRFCIGK